MLSELSTQLLDLKQEATRISPDSEDGRRIFKLVEHIRQHRDAHPYDELPTLNQEILDEVFAEFDDMFSDLK